MSAKNKYIIVKKEGKSGAVVIMNGTRYFKIAGNRLNDSNLVKEKFKLL